MIERGRSEGGGYGFRRALWSRGTSRPSTRRGEPRGRRRARQRSLQRLLLRAELELSRVQQRALGLRLLSAALVSLRARGSGLALRPFAWEDPDARAWARAVRAELARTDARERGVVRLLVRMTTQAEAEVADGAPTEWPRALWLARLGARLAPGRCARLTHAQLAFAEGRTHAAERALVQLAAEPLLPEQRARVLFLLGRCHLAAGRESFALGVFDAASDEPESDLPALVESLALAHVLRDEERVRRASARLDLQIETRDPAFRSALADLAARVEAGRFPSDRAGRPRAQTGSPAERVLAVVGA